MCDLTYKICVLVLDKLDFGGTESLVVEDRLGDKTGQFVSPLIQAQPLQAVSQHHAHGALALGFVVFFDHCCFVFSSEIVATVKCVWFPSLFLFSTTSLNFLSQ